MLKWERRRDEAEKESRKKRSTVARKQRYAGKREEKRGLKGETRSKTNALLESPYKR